MDVGCSSVVQFSGNYKLDFSFLGFMLSGVESGKPSRWFVIDGRIISRALKTRSEPRKGRLVPDVSING